MIGELLRLRGRIMMTAIAASAAALLAVLVAVGPGLRRSATGHVRETLFAEARLMAHVVEEPLAQGAGSEVLDPLVDAAAREVHARVTIVALDGRVLADSSLSGAELAKLENHKDRPEVREALALGSGTSVRHSATINEDLLYTAVAVRHQGRLVGVSRVALSLSGVEQQIGELRSAVWVALALAFVITALLSAAVSSRFAGPLHEIMDTARKFATGDLSARIRVGRADELGELARILNQSADHLQERLAENVRERARTEAILSAMADGVLAVDHRGVVLLANDALRHNLDLRDPVGRHHVEAIRQREVGKLLGEVLETGGRRSRELSLARLRRVFALTAVPFPGDQGRPRGAVLTFHDITERRRLEQVRRDFVANASHELRTPLTSIRGFVEALEDGAINDPATAARFLEKIRNHADRMAALVEDLLELSRLEAGERPVHFEEVLPSEVVEDVMASFSGLAERKGMRLIDTSGGAPPIVTDAERLRRILENLVDNALKYTPAGGRVEVSASAAAEGGVRVQVMDDGPGIPAEHLPRIFERFYRVDKARSREMAGTGLGLAIVRHLAGGMGATVDVSSEPGKGTTFTVALPPEASRAT